MSDDIRGDIFVSDATKLSIEELVTRTYDILGPAQRYEHDATVGHTVRVLIPLETILDQVGQRGGASTEFAIENIQFLFLFTGFSSSSYRTIEIFADEAYFDADDEDFNAEARGRFTAVWAHLCDHLEADYAYFAPLLNLVDDDVIESEVLPVLGKETSVEDRAEYMLYTVCWRNWLTYLSSRLVQEIPDEQLENLEKSGEVKITKMPSGGLFFESEKTPY